MTQSYEVYGQTDVPWELREDLVPAGSGRDGAWQVAVEFANNRERGQASIVEIAGHAHASRDDALATARRTAFTFDPPDPYAPQSRQVFRDGADGFLVIIHGATTVWHMSVRVVQFLGQV